ncbi:unnamed protein product [Trichobilharzia szidati]|nr:unnamed protein product [Trichobilharzia szidati]
MKEVITKELDNLIQLIKEDKYDQIIYALQKIPFLVNDINSNNQDYYFIAMKHHLNYLEFLLNTGQMDKSDTVLNELIHLIKLLITLGNDDNWIHDIQQIIVQHINSSLEQSDPSETLKSLVQIGSPLRLLIKTSLNDIWDVAMEVYRYSALYHTELCAARLDKGSCLTMDELIAAVEVLAYVVKLNQALDVENRKETIKILNTEDAYWVNFIPSDIKHNINSVSNFYFQNLLKFRQFKYSQGLYPILTHADIQNILNSTHDEIQIQFRQIQAFNGNEHSETSLCYSHINAKMHWINQLLNNLISFENPHETYRLLNSTPYPKIKNMLRKSHEVIDLYHSFLSIPKVISELEQASFQLNSEAYCYLLQYAIERSHNLINRIKRLGSVLKSINQYLCEGDSLKITYFLQHKALDLLKYYQLYVQCTGRQDQLTDEQINFKNSLNLLNQFEDTVMETFQKYVKDKMENCQSKNTGFQVSNNQMNPLNSSLFSKWLWSYVTVVDENDNNEIYHSSDYFLRNQFISFYYNIESEQITYCPIIEHWTNEVVNSKAHPHHYYYSTHLWNKNLKHILMLTRMKNSVKTDYIKKMLTHPPSTDPQLLNREDIIECLLIVINHITHMTTLNNQNTSNTPESMTLTIEQQIKAGDNFDRHHYYFNDYLTNYPFYLINIQALCKGYLTRLKVEQYKLRLNACKLIQSKWRQIYYKKYAPFKKTLHNDNAISFKQLNKKDEIDIDILNKTVIKLQALWRSKNCRRYYRDLFQIAYNNNSKYCRNHNQQDREHTFSKYHHNNENGKFEVGDSALNIESPRSCLNIVLRFINNLTGRAIEKAYIEEARCFQLIYNIIRTVYKLKQTSIELINSDHLIGLLIRARINKTNCGVNCAVPSNNRIKEFQRRNWDDERKVHRTTQRQMHQPQQHHHYLKEQECITLDRSECQLPLMKPFLQTYGQLCYLFYSQPDYLVNLIYSLPKKLLWTKWNTSSVSGSSPHYSLYSVTTYGLCIERAIFSIYSYALYKTDELRLIYLICRLFHKELKRYDMLKNQQCCTVLEKTEDKHDHNKDRDDSNYVEDGEEDSDSDKEKNRNYRSKRIHRQYHIILSSLSTSFAFRLTISLAKLKTIQCFNDETMENSHVNDGDAIEPQRFIEHLIQLFQSFVHEINQFKLNERSKLLRERLKRYMLSSLEQFPRKSKKSKKLYVSANKCYSKYSTRSSNTEGFASSPSPLPSIINSVTSLQSLSTPSSSSTETLSSLSSSSLQNLKRMKSSESGRLMNQNHFSRRSLKSSDDDLQSDDSNTKIQYHHLANAAYKFFHGVFIDPGQAALPQCLKYIMHQLYTGLVVTFPEVKQSEHLKFIGQMLLHAYYSCVIITPDLHQLLNVSKPLEQSTSSPSIILSFCLNDRQTRSIDRLETGRKHSSSPNLATATGDHRISFISRSNRRVLIAISNLFHSVITCKQYENTKYFGLLAKNAQLKSMLNSCIRVWHSHFHQYMLDIVVQIKSDSKTLTSVHSALRGKRIESSLCSVEELCVKNRNDSFLYYHKTFITTWISGLQQDIWSRRNRNDLDDDSDGPDEMNSSEIFKDKHRHVQNPHIINITARELFELHHLLVNYRDQIIFHLKDPLSQVLNSIGAPPRCIILKESSHLIKQTKTNRICNILDQSINETYQSVGNSVHQTSNEFFDRKLKQNKQGIKYYTDFDVNSALKRFKDENRFAYLVRYSSKNSTEVNKLKQPQPQQQPHHRLDGYDEFKLILGAEELEVTLLPVSEVEILSSSLYSACASITQITDCNLPTFRPCHSTTNKSGALLNQKKHKSDRELIRKHNCELCRHQLTSMLHCTTTCLAFSSILQTAFRQYQYEHQVNYIKRRSPISIRSTRMHTRLNPNEILLTDSSMKRGEEHGGLNKSPYSTDQQPDYDWLAARKLLIRIMDRVQSIKLCKWDKNILVHINNADSLCTWLEQLDKWVCSTLNILKTNRIGLKSTKSGLFATSHVLNNKNEEAKEESGHQNTKQFSRLSTSNLSLPTLNNSQFKKKYMALSNGKDYQLRGEEADSVDEKGKVEDKKIHRRVEITRRMLTRNTTVSGEETSHHLIIKFIENLKQDISKLWLTLKRLHKAGLIRVEDGYNTLITSLARDICHLNRPCQMVEWLHLKERLNQVLKQLNSELRSVDQQATIYAAHALLCLTPNNMKNIENNKIFSKKSKNTTNLLMSAPLSTSVVSVKRYKFTLSQLKKLNFLKHQDATDNKLLKRLQLIIEPLCHLTVAGDNIDCDDDGDDDTDDNTNVQSDRFCETPGSHDTEFISSDIDQSDSDTDNDSCYGRLKSWGSSKMYRSTRKLFSDSPSVTPRSRSMSISSRSSSLTTRRNRQKRKQHHISAQHFHHCSRQCHHSHNNKANYSSLSRPVYNVIPGLFKLTMYSCGSLIYQECVNLVDLLLLQEQQQQQQKCKQVGDVNGDFEFKVNEKLSLNLSVLINTIIDKFYT